MAHIVLHPHSNAIDCGSNDNIIRFTADAKGGPERLWFDCDIHSDQEDGDHIVIELHHSNTLLGCNDDTQIFPVWKSDDGQWQRLTQEQRKVLDDGRCVVSWTVETPQHHGRLAACYPYTRKDLDVFLHSLSPTLRCDEIGVSAQGRSLPRVVNKIHDTDSQQPGVFITARQHAGETPGSWVLEGILQSFATQQENDPMVWVLPFIDLDGVEEGRYGKNHFPHDHNRSWYGSGLCHETRVAMSEAQRWAQRCQPMLYLDVHAPGYVEENCYFFCGETDNDSTTSAFLSLCQKNIGTHCNERFIRQASYQSVACQEIGIPQAMTGEHFFKQQFNCVAVAFECSYQSFHGVAASCEDYRSIGEALATSIRSYCAENI